MTPKTKSFTVTLDNGVKVTVTIDMSSLHTMLSAAFPVATQISGNDYPAYGMVWAAPYTAPATPTVGTPTQTWTGAPTGDGTDWFNTKLAGMVDGGTYVLPEGQTVHHGYALGNRDNAFALAKNVTLVVNGVLDATDVEGALYLTGCDGFNIIVGPNGAVGSSNKGSRGSSFYRNMYTFKDGRGVRLFDPKGVGSNAAGAFFHNMKDSFSVRGHLKDTNADGATFVGGCERCYTLDVETENCGDDNFSIVSYLADPTNVDCGHIRPRANGNTNGRGTTIVGGTRCFILTQNTTHTSSAGTMMAREANGDFETHPPIDCWIRGGTIDSANYGTDDHGSILILNQKANSTFAGEVGNIVVTNAQNGRPVVNCKNGNTGGAAMDGTEVWSVSLVAPKGSYYTPTPFSTDGSIPRTNNATGRAVAASGVTFNGCTA